jgi:site-specific DNA recombinase
MDEPRAAMYARASSDRFPIAHQLAALRARVADDEVRVPAEWELVDDGRSSGATLVRPGLDRLRALSAEGGIDRLYVQSPDRLARTYAQQALLLNEFQAAGIEVVFGDRCHTAPDGMTLVHG